MARGFRGKCPECGGGRLFAGYVRTRDVCAVCGLNLDGHESDDAPPYVTIMIVGHVAVPLALAARQGFDLPLGVQFAIWGPGVIAMTAWLLPACSTPRAPSRSSRRPVRRASSWGCPGASGVAGWSQLA